MTKNEQQAHADFINFALKFSISFWTNNLSYIQNEKNHYE